MALFSRLLERPAAADTRARHRLRSARTARSRPGRMMHSACFSMLFFAPGFTRWGSRFASNSSSGNCWQWPIRQLGFGRPAQVRGLSPRGWRFKPEAAAERWIRADRFKLRDLNNARGVAQPGRDAQATVNDRGTLRLGLGLVSILRNRRMYLGRFRRTARRSAAACWPNAKLGSRSHPPSSPLRNPAAKASPATSFPIIVASRTGRLGSAAVAATLCPTPPNRSVTPWNANRDLA
jgi:hypothetical protein